MKKILLVIMLLFYVSLCFAQVKSFDILDVEDVEDIKDNIVLVNKTKSDIVVAALYGISCDDCPNGFVLSDFVSKNGDDSYTISPKAEKIMTFRGVNAGKSQKIDFKKKYNVHLFKKFRYLILHVEEPESFEFSITDLREKHSDLYIYVTGSGTTISEKSVSKKDSPEKQETVKPLEKKASEKKTNDKKSEKQSSKKATEVITLKLGEYECGTFPDIKIKLTPLGTVLLKRGNKSLGVGTYEMSGNRLSISWTTLSKDGQGIVKGKNMNATITDDTSFKDEKTWVYVEK